MLDSARATQAVVSLLTRAKISAALTGQVMSDATRLAMSRSRTGP